MRTMMRFYNGQHRYKAAFPFRRFGGDFIIESAAFCKASAISNMPSGLLTSVS
jgi:hypothetical protein